MPYERPNIHELHAYTPGEQPGAAERVIKLNTNENPYPPAPAVMEAIRSVSAERLRLYPPPAADAFRTAAARVHGLDPSQVIATNGGDELLRLVVTVFCEPRSGDGSAAGLGYAVPSYTLYETLAAIHNTQLVRIPLGEDFDLTVDFAAKLNEARCRLAMVVNPHAPSGRLESIDTLRAIAREFRGVLLIDQAYVDFAPRDAVELVREGSGLDNVLLLRSLSKGYSLAGLRFGYGLGSPGLIAALDKARDSYNTDVLSQAAATAAITHRDHAAESWKKVIAERGRLTDTLCGLGWNVLPSTSNFILAQPPVDAKALYQSLKQRGILVRYFDQDRLRDRLRITIGTPEQNDALLASVRELCPAQPSRT